ENDTEYVITFKTKKISGSVTTVAGHSTLAVHSTTRVFVDGEEIVPLSTGWSNTKANSYPDDTNTHHVEVRLKTVSDVPNVVTPLYLYIQPNRPSYATDYVMDIWDWQLEKGNVATDWTPAPEDVDASIQAVQTTADGKNSIFRQN